MLSEVRHLVLIVRCIPAAAAVIVPAEIFPAHAGQVVRLLQLQDMSAKHHFKKSFLRQKNKHRLLSGGVCMAAGLSVLFAGGVDNIQGTVSPVYSAPYGVNAAAFDAAAQFLLKFQAYFPSADEGCFSVASGMDEQFHGKAVGKVNGGLFDFIRGNGDFQSVVLILKLFSNRSNNLLFSSYIHNLNN